MNNLQNYYPQSMQHPEVMFPMSSGLIVPLSYIQRLNQAVAIANEYNKNYNNVFEAQTLYQRQRDLSGKPILNLPFGFDNLDISNIDKKLQDTVQALVSGTKASDQAALVLIFTNILIATQGNVYVALNPGHEEYPSIYAFLASEPGNRKTTIMKRGISPFEKFIEEKNANAVHDDIRGMVKSEIKQKTRKEIAPMIDDIFENFSGPNTSREDIMSLAGKVRDIQEAVIPQKQDLLVGSSTSSGLLSSLEKNNGHLAVVSAEGDIIPSLLKDKQLISYFKHGYDFEDIGRTTGRGNISVSKPSLNLSLYLQPSEFVKILNNTDMQTQGFTARCIFLIDIEREERYFPYTLDGYNEKILSVLRQFFYHSGSRKICKIKATNEAIQELRTFENHIKTKLIPTYPEKSLPALRKLHGLAARFALAYHIWITDDPLAEEISLHSMQVGIQIATSLLPQILFVYHEYGYSAVHIAQKILNYIINVDVTQRQNLLNGGIELSYIAKRIHKTIAETEKGIGYLQRCNALRLYENGSSKCKVILHSNFFNYYAPQSVHETMQLF